MNSASAADGSGSTTGTVRGTPAAAAARATTAGAPTRRGRQTPAAAALSAATTTRASSPSARMMVAWTAWARARRRSSRPLIRPPGKKLPWRGGGRGHPLAGQSHGPGGLRPAASRLDHHPPGLDALDRQRLVDHQGGLAVGIDLEHAGRGGVVLVVEIPQ